MENSSDINDIKDVLYQEKVPFFKRIYRSKGKILSVFILGSVVGYGAYLAFGPNSLSVLLKLKHKRENLLTSEEFLKMENEKLQRELFELKGL